MLSHYRKFLIHATKTVLSSTPKMPSETVAYPTTSNASPLRYYSAMQAPKDKKNTSLTRHNPVRQLSATSIVTTGAWTIAFFLTGSRIMDRIDDEDYGYHYWHPWLRALCVAALIDIAAETKNACDRTAKFTSAILEAIKSNALPTLFKQYLNHPDVTSDNLYTLAICASNTETLDVLLNCTQELGPDYSKRLFDAVRKHASQDFCDSFLGKARENGIVVESSPGMRPG